MELLLPGSLRGSPDIPRFSDAQMTLADTNADLASYFALPFLLLGLPAWLPELPGLCP